MKKLLAFLMLATAAKAALYVEDFETFPPGYVSEFDIGDNEIYVAGMKAVVGVPGPLSWGSTYLTPDRLYTCSQGFLILEEPVYAITIQVTSVTGHETDLPITTCYSDDYGLSFRSGPGTRQDLTSWPHTRYANTGWGYAFIAGSEQVPIINRCVVENGDIGKITIQTHPLSQNQLRLMREGKQVIAEEAQD